jgi:ankyrin repeat protein
LIDRGALLTTAKVTPQFVGMELVEKNQPQLLQRYVAKYPPLKEGLIREPEWLHLAAKSSGAAMLKYLLDLGANINGTTKTSVSPLMTAATAGNVETVKVLLERKANTSLRNARNRTALQVAIQAGHTEVVAVMRAQG